jgi:hypothetical protein
MIELLQLGRAQGAAGYTALRGAIEAALALGCSDAAAVRYLLTARAATTRAADAPASLIGLAATPPTAAPLALDELGRLARYERPLPEVSSYDQLLASAPSLRSARAGEVAP